MRLSWLFGSSMAQHHLLYAYLSVWIIQGGYCAWVGWKWFGVKQQAPSPPLPPSSDRGGSQQKPRGSS